MSYTRFLSRLYLLVRQWAEPTRLYVDSFDPVKQHTLSVTSVEGYDFHIRCIERGYREVPLSGTTHKRSFVVYELSTHVSDDAPPALQAATQIKITLPPPYPSWVGTEHQIDRVIQQYLDLLYRHIELHTLSAA